MHQTFYSLLITETYRNSFLSLPSPYFLRSCFNSPTVIVQTCLNRWCRWRFAISSCKPIPFATQPWTTFATISSCPDWCQRGSHSIQRFLVPAVPADPVSGSGQWSLGAQWWLWGPLKGEVYWGDIPKLLKPQRNCRQEKWPQLEAYPIVRQTHTLFNLPPRCTTAMFVGIWIPLIIEICT